MGRRFRPGGDPLSERVLSTCCRPCRIRASVLQNRSMELRGSEEPTNNIGESPEAPTSPALPSKKDVILVVLFFFLVTFVFHNIRVMLLFRLAYDFSQHDENLMALLINSGMAAWYLNFIDGRATLIASVLLYFGVARRGSRRERRLRRGEVITGLVNLHIFLLALVMPFASLFWGEISEVYLGGILVTYVVSTALWCAVGFHLCEGRYLLPLGGILLWHLSALVFSLTWGGWPLSLSALEYLVGPVLGLVWQVGTLIRAGSGFDLFPTGLWPAIKRCAPVLVPIAACFWLLSEIPGFLAAGSESFLMTTGISSQLGRSIDLPIAYLVPIFFLGWEGTNFEHRSRKLTYVLVGVGILLVLLCLPLAFVVPYTRLGWYWFSGFTEMAFVAILPLSSVFIPLSICRWWVRGGFIRPVGIAAVGPVIFGLLILVLGTENELAGFAFAAGRIVTILLVAVFLFRRIPPRRDFSCPTVS